MIDIEVRPSTFQSALSQELLVRKLPRLIMIMVYNVFAPDLEALGDVSQSEESRYEGFKLVKEERDGLQEKHST